MSIEAWRKLSCRNCHKRTDQIKTDRKNPKTGFAHAHDTARRNPNLWRGRSHARRLVRGAFGGAGDFTQPFMIIVPCHRVLEAGSYADRISPNGGVISKRRLLSIEGIVTLLRGQPCDLSDVALDMGGIHAFNARVYSFVRTIPRGDTLTYGEVAAKLRASGAAHSVAQAISKNPFMLIVPCHRVLEAGSYTDKISPNGGVISKRRLLSLEGGHTIMSKTLFDVLLPVAPPRAQG